MKHKGNKVMRICIYILLIGVLYLSAAEQQSVVPDIFITRWQITVPIPVGPSDTSMEAQEKAFQENVVPADQIIASLALGKLTVNGIDYPWRTFVSPSNAIDLAALYNRIDYHYVYAVADISADAGQKAVLGIGSDDAVQMWLNGVLVHENFRGRPVTIDEDLMGVSLLPGKNTLIVKIHNLQGDWGFAVRPLSQASLAEKLVDSAGDGNMQTVTLLLENGVNPNSIIGPGLTAAHIATIKGNRSLIDLLVKFGADTLIKMPKVEELIDFTVSRAKKEDYPGASVLVAQDGKIVYQQCIGMANVDKSVPIIPETTFRIGSITKQFTAASILKLQEQGKLSVQDKLSQYFSDFPRGDDVTLHHLLTHTSGIASYTDAPGFIDQVTGDISTEEMITWIKSLGYTFSPGESWAYCNSGYYLLGVIVEQVSGRSFDQFLKETFFQSLGMTSSGVYRRGLNLAHEAVGYQYQNDAVSLALDWNMDFAGGAGNLYANVGDLYRWNEAIFAGKILSPSSLTPAFTPVVLNSGEKAAAMGGSYGYGWSLVDVRGLSLIEHGGGLHGFSTFITRVPDKKMTVVVLSNAAANIPHLSPGNLAHQIIEMTFYGVMKEQNIATVEQPVDFAAFDDYVGQYDYGQAMMTIRRSGNHLLAQLGTQPEFEIFPSGANKFFWKMAAAQIEFVRDENGRVTHGLHTQNGATLKVPRIPEEKEIQLSAQVLEQYVGDYELAPGFILSITREGTQLYSQATGQSRVEIYPKSETEFFLRVVVASLTFVKDENGAVKAVVLDQGSVHREAPKIK
ncbi:MAG: DUF3471 domain-containing protein [Calditrichaeota bacterium]|nr:MAG: DUF3471 domain-containing protein [Calditrichota bacterium]